MLLASYSTCSGERHLGSCGPQSTTRLRSRSARGDPPSLHRELNRSQAAERRRRVEPERRAFRHQALLE